MRDSASASLQTLIDVCARMNDVRGRCSYVVSCFRYVKKEVGTGKLCNGGNPPQTGEKASSAIRWFLMLSCKEHYFFSSFIRKSERKNDPSCTVSLASICLSWCILLTRSNRIRHLCFVQLARLAHAEFYKAFVKKHYAPINSKVQNPPPGNPPGN